MNRSHKWRSLWLLAKARNTLVFSLFLFLLLALMDMLFSFQRWTQQGTWRGQTCPQDAPWESNKVPRWSRFLVSSHRSSQQANTPQHSNLQHLISAPDVNVVTLLNNFLHFNQIPPECVLKERCDPPRFGGHESLHVHDTEQRRVKGFALRHSLSQAFGILTFLFSFLAHKCIREVPSPICRSQIMQVTAGNPPFAPWNLADIKLPAFVSGGGLLACLTSELSVFSVFPACFGLEIFTRSTNVYRSSFLMKLSLRARWQI